MNGATKSVNELAIRTLESEIGTIELCISRLEEIDNPAVNVTRKAEQTGKLRGDLEVKRHLLRLALGAAS